MSAAILQYVHATRVPLQEDAQATRLPLRHSRWNATSGRVGRLIIRAFGDYLEPSSSESSIHLWNDAADIAGAA
ncbi:MAG: hypothetical protein DMF00_08545 [Verrucomicrobia bacterium]|nr:MAG: hypothetical protein DMF00_08545 [Verrucomicrobiota bacterium]